VLFISGTKSGVEIDLNSLFIQLADKPVTELYLVRNYAGTRTIPESIGNLTKLKKLALYGNQISTLPGSIQNLTGLEELYVDLNPIERLPDDIGRLKNLKMLGVAKTGINESEKSRIQKLVPNCKILIK
jgi:Leucine-rich repeat (LRR) protein